MVFDKKELQGKKELEEKKEGYLVK